MGFQIEGIKELLEIESVPVHVQEAELPWVQRVTECAARDLVGHSSGDKVDVGDISIELNPDGAELALADKPRHIRSGTRAYPYDGAA